VHLNLKTALTRSILQPKIQQISFSGWAPTEDLGLLERNPTRTKPYA